MNGIIVPHAVGSIRLGHKWQGCVGHTESNTAGFIAYTPTPFSGIGHFFFEGTGRKETCATSSVAMSGENPAQDLLMSSPPMSPLNPMNRKHSLDSQSEEVYQWLLSDKLPSEDEFNFHEGIVDSKQRSTAAASDSGKKPSSQKRSTLSTSSRQPNKKSEKSLSRLEKNRQSARDCRKRKKERVQQLEERVHMLERSNQELRVQLKIGRDSAEQDEAEKWRITNLIRKMVEEGETDAKISETIDMFKERYADYGQERRCSIRYHIDQLEGLLQPTIVTKMGLWSLHQDDEFYEDEQGKQTIGQSIWNILCKELNVTDAQKKKIMSYRGRIRSLCSELKTSLHLLSNLRGTVENKNTALEREMQEIQGILTPQQSAKFVLWVSDNPACMQMLEQLWSNMHDKTFSESGNGTASSVSGGVGKTGSNAASKNAPPGAAGMPTSANGGDTSPSKRKRKDTDIAGTKTEADRGYKKKKSQD